MDAITRSIQRDEYIMAQALYVAIRAMKAVEPEYLREPSNIYDMEAIMNARFPHYIGIFDIQYKERDKYLATLAAKDEQDGDRD